MNSLDRLLETLPPAGQCVVSAIVNAQMRHSLLPAGRESGVSPAPVVVGVSGGADSVCLVHALWLLAPHWNLELHVAHVDHGLRAEASLDADFVRELARSLRAEFHIRRLDGAALRRDERGVEAAARAERYAFLAEVARTVSDKQVASLDGKVALRPTVAVAHHADDQAETVLMNFVRGSGLRGLSGMPWERTLAGDASHGDSEGDGCVRLVRPLLALRRRQLVEYNEALGLSHREDATNIDVRNLRNRVRHETLPALTELNAQIVETLARTAELLRAEADRAMALDYEALVSVTVEESAPVRYVIDATHLMQHSLAAQRGVLRSMCEVMGLELRDAGFQAIDEVLSRVQRNGGAGGPYSLAGGLSWSLFGAANGGRMLSMHRRDALPLRPEYPHLFHRQSEHSLPLPIECPGEYAVTHNWLLRCRLITVDELPPGWRTNEDTWRAYMDANCVGTPVLTAPVAGLKFAPLGMSGQHKSLGDYLTDRKTPSALRAQWPIVTDARDGAVLWVCGHTIADAVRVTDATVLVLCLEWVSLPQAGSDTSTPALAKEHSGGLPCAQM